MLIYTTLNWLNLPQKDLSEAKKYIQKWLQCRKARVFFLSTRANICPIAGFSPSDALVQIRDIHGRRCGLCHAGRARIDLLFPLKKSRWETKPPVNVMWCMPWHLTQIDFHTFVEKFTLDALMFSRINKKLSRFPSPTPWDLQLIQKFDWLIHSAGFLMKYFLVDVELQIPLMKFKRWFISLNFPVSNRSSWFWIQHIQFPVFHPNNLWPCFCFLQRAKSCV